MTEKNQAEKLLQSLDQAGPGQEGWEDLRKELVRRFSRLDPEDQVQVAEKLAALGPAEQVAPLMAELIDKKGVSLAAMMVLAKALAKLGRSWMDEDTLAQMEKWALACEDDSVECSGEDFFDLPDKVQAAVLDHLALWLKVDALKMLQESAPVKARAKAVAKALHRAKSAGATVGEDSPVRFTLTERDEYVDQAYISPPDATGTMFIYLYRTIFGKNNLFVVLVNDLESVIRIEGFQVTPPRFQRILDSTKRNPHAIIVKADAGYARLLIKKSEDKARDRSKRLDEGYLSSRRALGIPDQEDVPHPLWSHLDREELKTERGLVHQSQQLISHRMFEDWVLMPVNEGKFIVDLEDKRMSLLEISERQKQEQEDLLYEKAAQEVLDFSGREVWRDRLFTSAYVGVLIEDMETARAVAAVALAIEDPDQPPPPFFIELLRRSVEKAVGSDEEDQGSSGPEMDRGGIVIA